MVKPQFGEGIKKFRYDNTKDYFNQVLSPYFKKEGIIHESSCVSTPQQNGVGERKNGYLLVVTRTFSFHKMFLNHIGGSNYYCCSSWDSLKLMALIIEKHLPQLPNLIL